MISLKVVSKRSGDSTPVSVSEVLLNEAAVVRVGLSREQIRGMRRVGNDRLNADAISDYRPVGLRRDLYAEGGACDLHDPQAFPADTGVRKVLRFDCLIYEHDVFQCVGRAGR